MEPNLLPSQKFLELKIAVSEGYIHRFIPLHNGCLYCTADENIYEIDELDFLQDSVTTIKATLFRIQTACGIRGTYFEIN